MFYTVTRCFFRMLEYCHGFAHSVCEDTVIIHIYIDRFSGIPKLSQMNSNKRHHRRDETLLKRTAQPRVLIRYRISRRSGAGVLLLHLLQTYPTSYLFSLSYPHTLYLFLCLNISLSLLHSVFRYLASYSGK